MENRSSAGMRSKKRSTFCFGPVLTLLDDLGLSLDGGNASGTPDVAKLIAIFGSLKEADWRQLISLAARWRENGRQSVELPQSLSLCEPSNTGPASPQRETRMLHRPYSNLKSKKTGQKMNLVLGISGNSPASRTPNGVG